MLTKSIRGDQHSTENKGGRICIFLHHIEPFRHCKESADCNNLEELGNYYYMIRS